MPAQYRDMLGARSASSSSGKLIVFAAFGLYEKWWRYFRLPDFVDVVRRVDCLDRDPRRRLTC